MRKSSRHPHEACRTALRVRLIPAFLVLLGTARFVSVAAAQTVVSVYNSAALKIRSGDFKAGCAEAHALAEKVPQFFGSYNLLGMCAMQRGEIAKAEANFRKSIELNPRFVEARNNLAALLIQTGNSAEGKVQLLEVLQLDPNNLSALFNLGRVELAKRAYSQAAIHLRKAAELASADLQIQVALSAALYGSQDKEAARQVIGGLARHKAASQALVTSAIVSLDFSDESMARESLNRAISLDPGIRTQLLTEARAQCDRQQFRGAGVLLEFLAESHAESAEWNALSGYVAYKLNEPAKAAENLRKAIELDPQVEDYYLKIGELMLFHNSDKAAIAFLEVGLERFPDSLRLNTAMAVAYIARGADANVCLRYLDKALSLQKDFAPALSLYCMALEQLKEWDKLTAAAERLIRYYPKSHEGYYYKGRALMEGPGIRGEAGAVRAAREALEHSVRLNPESAAVRVALGTLLYRSGSTDRAIVELERAAALDSDNSQAFWQLSMAYGRAGQADKRAHAVREAKRLLAVQEQKLLDSYKALFQVSK